MKRALPNLVVLSVVASATAGIRIEQIPGQAETGTVEIHGVAAGAFEPAMWEAGTLNFVPDARHPMIAPKLAGVFRNIYAPSPVQVPGGWRLFYGAWDGVPTGNDRIYSVTTANFLDFTDRHTVIDHGAFIHVCNVNAIRMADGSFRLICTAYPDAKGKNKPSFFASSPDGNTWNGSPAPYAAKAGDVVTMEGYPPYEMADINGMNVIHFENGTYQLYFGNFTQTGHVHRAASKDGRHYRYEGVCLDTPHMINDMRKLTPGARPTYLMALHANTSKLWYSLSPDGMKFGPEREMAQSLGEADKYIVAVGWVLHDDRVLGFVYGAGAVPTLNRNRLFARWLQKKLVFTGGDGASIAGERSLGPDRQVLSLGSKPTIQGRIEMFAENGKTPLGAPMPVKLISGAVYRIVTGSTN